MKLWKNNLPQKSQSIISINNNKNDMKKLSINSLELNKNNPINRTSKESNEKSNDSIIKLINNKNISFISSSDEEKSAIKNENLRNSKKNVDNLFLNKNKEFNNILITTFPSGFDSKQKIKKSNNKTIYPKIQTKENPILKSVSSFAFNKYKKYKFKTTNSLSPLQTNTILNKWREDFHKIFLKTIKRTKADVSSTFQRCNRNKNRLRIKIERNLKKKIVINSKPIKDNNKNNNTIEENNKIIENINNDNNIEGSSERKKNGIMAKTLQIETSSITSSPLKLNTNYSKSPKRKFLITAEQYSGPSSISSKSINNKFDSSQANIKIYKNYKRKRTFHEYMKENNILNQKWKKKIGVLDSEVKYSKNLLGDLNFQSNTIKDEMNLLIDGIHHYKMRLFGNNDLITAFINKDILYQINLNKSLEETCALLHLIPKLILKEYYIYADRFISIAEPGRENFFSKIITNESECLNENIKLLYKIINFVKSSFEVYIQLVHQVEEEMIIPPHDFEILRAIFQKSRYYIGNLINFANNILKDYNFDKKLIKKCRPILEHTKERLKYDWRFDKFKFHSNIKNNKNKRNQNYFNYNIKRNKNKDSIYTKMHSNINFVNNDFYQKILRITKALETGGEPKNMQNNYADKLKLKQAGVGNRNGPMALIYSPLMSKMMKYIRKDIREKIISLRSSEKYIDSKDTG